MKYFIKSFLWVLVGVAQVTFSGENIVLDQTCSLTILNRTIHPKNDGSFNLGNVPVTFEPIKIKALCERNGETIIGETDYFSVEKDSTSEISGFYRVDKSTIPTALNFIPRGPLVMNRIGGTHTVTVLASMPNGSTINASNPALGTYYTSSNSNIVSVSELGVVTAMAPGNAMVTARKDGVMAVLPVTVTTGADSDGDGIPDDIEILHGLDPNDPNDALLDIDRDGLTAAEEILYGTNIRERDSDGDGLADGEEVNHALFTLLANNRDTDGDGIYDGREIVLGTKPDDANDVDYSQDLQSIYFMPAMQTLAISNGAPAVQSDITLRGRLANGEDISLLSDANVAIVSDEPSIARVDVPENTITAIGEGKALISADYANTGFMAQAELTVESFSAQVASVTNLDFYANELVIIGDYAYLAAGELGLKIVDITDPAAPIVLSEGVDTDGVAVDIVEEGGRLFLADGNNGVQIFSLENPELPVQIGHIATRDFAYDLAIVEDTLYIAASNQGLIAVDISYAPAPQVLALESGLGELRSVAANEEYVVAATTVDMKVFRIEADGELSLQAVYNQREIHDLAIRGNIIYAAADRDGLRTLEIFDNGDVQEIDRRNNPLPSSVDISPNGRWASTGDILNANAIPVFSVNPQTGILSIADALNLESEYTDQDGYAETLTNRHIYSLRANSGYFNEWWATSGLSSLYIVDVGEIEDLMTSPPSLGWSTVELPSMLTERQQLLMAVNAQDDVAVAAVEFYQDGQLLFTDTVEPYRAFIEIPSQESVTEISAIAIDYAGNRSAPLIRQLPVMPDVLAPSVEIETQQTNLIAALQGNYRFGIIASDNVGVAQVEYFVDNVLVATQDKGPFEYSGMLPSLDSSIEFKVVVTDVNGLSTESDTVIVSSGELQALIKPLDFEVDAQFSEVLTAVESGYFSTAEPEADYYRIEAEATEIIRLSADNLTSNSSFNLTLYDDMGNALSNAGLSAAPHLYNYQIPQTGVYFVEVKPSSSNASFEYELVGLKTFDRQDIYNMSSFSRAVAPAFSANVLGFESSAYGGVVSASDFYRYYLLKGEQVTFTASALSVGDMIPVINVFPAASASTPILTNENDGEFSNVQVQFIVPEDGLYYVGVNGRSTPSIRSLYRLNVSIENSESARDVEPNNDNATAQRIKVSNFPDMPDATVGTALGDFNYSSGNDTDYFVFNARAGDRLSARIYATDLSFNYYHTVVIKDAQGNELGRLDQKRDATLSNIVIPEDGDYFVEVWLFQSGRYGYYHLTLLTTNNAEQEVESSLANRLHLQAPAGGVFASRDYQGTLQSNSDTDVYELYLLAGDQFNFAVQGFGEHAPSPFIKLLNLSGELQTENLNAGLEHTVGLNFEVTVDGIYQIQVGAVEGGNGQGFYRVSSDITGRTAATDAYPSNSQDKAQRIDMAVFPNMPDATVGSALGDFNYSSGDDPDYFVFNARAGDQLSARIYATDFSFNYYHTVVIKDAQGNELGRLDQKRDATLSNIEIPEDGDYFAEVWLFQAGRYGYYHLTLLTTNNAEQEVESTLANRLHLQAPAGGVFASRDYQGTLQSNSDTDLYEIYLLAGDQFNFAVDGFGEYAPSPFIQLLNLNGDVQTENLNAGLENTVGLNFEVAVDGIYRIQVGAVDGGNDQGFYRVSSDITGRIAATDAYPSNNQDTAQRIDMAVFPNMPDATVGTAVGDFNYTGGDDTDYFVFNARAGDQLSARIYATDFSFNYYHTVVIKDAQGNELGRLDQKRDATLSNIEIPEDGDYFAEVWLFQAGRYGYYHLTLLTTNNAEQEVESTLANRLHLQAPAGGVLASRDYQGTLQSNSDTDVYEIYLLAGDQFNFAVQGFGEHAPSPFIKLLNLGGELQTENLNAGLEHTVGLNFEVAVDGIYQIQVGAVEGGNDQGFYRVSSDIAGRIAATDAYPSNNQDTAQRIDMAVFPNMPDATVGSAVGDFNYTGGDDTDYFVFNARAGDQLSARIYATDFSFNYYHTVVIKDAQGNELGRLDQKRDATLSNIEIPEDGDYFAEVWLFQSGSGYYHLTLLTTNNAEQEVESTLANRLHLQAPAGGVLASRDYQGTLQSNSDTDVYEIYLLAGDQFNVAVQGFGEHAPSPFIQLLNLGGELQTENLNAGLEHTVGLNFEVAVDGIYQIQVGAVDGGNDQGFYRVSSDITGRTAATDAYPSNSQDTAQRVDMAVFPNMPDATVGSAVGDFNYTGGDDTDYFVFNARAGDQLSARIYATDFSFNYYHTVVIKDAQGNELGRLDQKRDATLSNIVIPADGDYFVEVWLYRTGTYGYYHLTLSIQ